ncbi:MAG: hypothetical protein WC473_03635 [Patescibacteria group bacterium]
MSGGQLSGSVQDQQQDQQSGGSQDKPALAVPRFIFYGLLLCLGMMLFFAFVVGGVKKDVSSLTTRVIALAANQSVTDEAQSVTNEALAFGVAKAKSRLDKRVQTENEQLLVKWRTIRDRGGDDSELGQKSEKEIKRLLTNGIWDIESTITKEYDELMATSISDVSALADTANKKAKAAQAAADNAQITANVSIRATEIIAQPTACAKHSVSKEQKKSLQELLAEYRQSQAGS